MPQECCEIKLTGSSWQRYNKQLRPNITPGLWGNPHSAEIWEET